MTDTQNTVRLAIEVLDSVAGANFPHRVSIRFWDGTLWPDANPRPTTIVLKHPGAVRAIFKPPIQMSLGESYLRDDWDVEGVFEDVSDLYHALDVASLSWGQKAGAALKVLQMPSGNSGTGSELHQAKLSGTRHSRARDQAAVAFHYNASNDFFKLWLDKRMVYSCAYFRTPETDLETAQLDKLDMICRKLRLQPGQKMLDIGCGWGALVIHAAKHYGVEATGITLSRPQVEEAQGRILDAGLEGRCRVLLRDYRDMSGQYDALSSVGMVEHVGEAKLPAYFANAWQLLREGGVFLNHGISGSFGRGGQKGPNFIDAYVFPDGELVPIDVLLKNAEAAGFETRDVESWREHYATTLRHWVQRLEANREPARQFVDEAGYRIWRIYMSASAHGFATRRMNLYQTLLVKPHSDNSSGLPLTRESWYQR